MGRHFYENPEFKEITKEELCMHWSKQVRKEINVVVMPEIKKNENVVPIHKECDNHELKYNTELAPDWKFFKCLQKITILTLINKFIEDNRKINNISLLKTFNQELWGKAVKKSCLRKMCQQKLS